MDFFAHIAWSMILFGKFFNFSYLIQISFFSVLPDLLWGIPAVFYMIYFMLKNRKILSWKKRPTKFTKKLENLYNSSHSFSVMILFFFIFSIIFSQFYWPILFGWGLHLLLDIFTHKDSIYFKQKPFYPLSNYSVRGYIWHGHWKFLILNWSAIILVYILFYGIRILGF